jgi:hypothetical protein
MLLWWIGVVCVRKVESIDHLLFHCEVARELWSSLFHYLGVSWVITRRVRDLLVSWKEQLGHCNVLEL